MGKIEIDRRMDHFKENWPGQYDYFSWMEFVAAAPQPLFLITTYKEHDVPNACFHSWGFWAGDKDGYLCLFSLNKCGHTYRDIQRHKAWCINYPTIGYQKQCFATIEIRDDGADEISGAGFTVEPAKKVHPPPDQGVFPQPGVRVPVGEGALQRACADGGQGRQSGTG